MWNHIKSTCLVIGDGLLGWMLPISPEATVILLAVASAMMFLAIRKFASSQSLLAALAYDRRRAAELRRQAKAEQDIETVARLTKLQNHLGLKRLTAELLPMLIALPTLLVLGVWAEGRLTTTAPQPGEPFTLRLQTPYAAVGRVVHLQPNDALACEQWIHVVESVDDADPPAGEAVWQLRRQSRTTNDQLVVPWGDESFVHPLSIGWGEPNLAIRRHSNGFQTELKLPTLDFWGLLGWLPVWLPAWLVVYLTVTFAVTCGLQWTLGVY